MWMVNSSMSWKMTKRKIRFLLLAILLSAVFVVSGIQIYGELAARQKEKNEFEELAALVEASQPDSMPWPDMEPEDGEEAMPEPEATEPAGAEEALRDLSALFARNGDCIGWLSIPDTAVDYPVMHTPENPQKYLRRSFYGEYSVSGVPFLDSRCSLGGDNLIIYGHNMKNGSMFAGLRGYTDSDFRAEHGQVELQTADGLTVYEVFAVVKTNNVDPWYAFTTAENEEAYGEAVRAMLAQAAYTSGTVPEYDQQLLTLSTCYGSSKSGRLLVIAAAP